MANPNPVRKFQPGESGNPGGRAKMDPELKQMLRTASKAAFDYLSALVADTKARHADRIRASEVLIERFYGKSPQPICGDDEGSAIVIKLAGELEGWGK